MAKTESKPLRIIPNIDGLSREFLHKHGKCVVDHIHHEEYDYNGFRYSCGWQSPSKRLGLASGWIVYKKEKLRTIRLKIVY